MHHKRSEIETCHMTYSVLPTTTTTQAKSYILGVAKSHIKGVGSTHNPTSLISTKRMGAHPFSMPGSIYTEVVA